MAFRDLVSIEPMSARTIVPDAVPPEAEARHVDDFARGFPRSGSFGLGPLGVAITGDEPVMADDDRSTNLNGFNDTDGQTYGHGPFQAWGNPAVMSSPSTR